MRCATCGIEDAVVLITLTQAGSHGEGGNIHEGMGATCARRWEDAPERRFFSQLLELQGGVNALQQYRDFQARMMREKSRAT